MPQPLSMLQVARELDLSRLTVSSVVNGKARQRGISAGTAARVRQHLLRRGYVPSRPALGLRASTSDRVGILHSGRLYSHLTEAFNRLVDLYHASPQRLEIVVVPPAELVRGLQELLARRVAQVLWIHARPPADELADPRIFHYAQHVRMVVYNFRFERNDGADELVRKGFQLIGVDRWAGYRRLGRRLSRLGHTVVALPQTAAECAPGGLPEQGLREAGLKVVACGPAAEASAPLARSVQAMVAALARTMKKEGVTAACFHDDELAGLALAELMRRGIRIPQDLSVTGFDGLPLAAAFRVPLTSLRVPVSKMVEAARRLSAPAEKPGRHCFELEWVEGASHGPAPRRRQP